MPLTATQTGFPACCGATIVHSLHTEPFAKLPDTGTPIHVLITNPEQASYSTELKKAGYKPQFTFLNHGRTLTFWVKGEITLVEKPRKAAGEVRAKRLLKTVR